MLGFRINDLNKIQIQKVLEGLKGNCQGQAKEFETYNRTPPAEDLVGGFSDTNKTKKQFTLILSI